MESREVYDAYIRAWNIRYRGERVGLLEGVWSDDAVYVEDEVPRG